MINYKEGINPISARSSEGKFSRRLRENAADFRNLS